MKYSFWATDTIDLLLNCFEFDYKNIIPLSFFYMQFFHTQSKPQGQLKLHQPHLHDMYW